MGQKTRAEYLGAILRRHRHDRDLTLEKVAEGAGIHSTSLGLIERGRRGVSVEALWEIARALDLSPVDLMAEIDSAFRRAPRTKRGRRRPTG